MSPHAALLKALLSRNCERPYDATFILYTDADGASSNLAEPSNVTVKLVAPPQRSVRKMPDEWWVNVALPRAARADHLGLFFSPYYKVPLALPTTRVNMIHDLSFFVLPDELVAPRYQSNARRWWLQRLMQLYCRRVKFTLTVSNYSKGCLQDILGLDASRIRVCPNGVDLETASTVDDRLMGDLKARLGLPDEYLLFVGSNIKKKNIEGLLAAYALLPQEQRARFPLVLKTTTRDALERRARDLGVLEHVMIVEEHLSDREMAALIGRAKAMALLSFDEGFGIPVAEAMAAGVPVVVSRGGALQEVVGDAGILVDPASAEEAARGLMRLLASTPAQYRQLSDRCRVRAEAFSVQRAADRLFAVMEEAMERRRPSTPASAAASLNAPAESAARALQQ